NGSGSRRESLQARSVGEPGKDELAAVAAVAAAKLAEAEIQRSLEHLPNILNRQDIIGRNGINQTQNAVSSESIAADAALQALLAKPATPVAPGSISCLTS